MGVVKIGQFYRNLFKRIVKNKAVGYAIIRLDLTHKRNVRYHLQFANKPHADYVVGKCQSRGLETIGPYELNPPMEGFSHGAVVTLPYTIGKFGIGNDNYETMLCDYNGEPLITHGYLDIQPILFPNRADADRYIKNNNMINVKPLNISL